MKTTIKRILREETTPFLITECVVVGIRLEDGVVLAKNRDRGYKANVEIIQKLVDGVEVVYWRDVDTDWSEGMNEFGIGIVNSSLMVKQDEKEGKKGQTPKKRTDLSRHRRAQGRAARENLVRGRCPRLL